LTGLGWSPGSRCNSGRSDCRAWTGCCGRTGYNSRYRSRSTGDYRCNGYCCRLGGSKPAPKP